MTLLISFLWHIFCISSVSIIFLPSGLIDRQNLSVCFLGSILKGPVFLSESQNVSKKQIFDPPPETKIERINNFDKNPFVSSLVNKKPSSIEDVIDVDAVVDRIPLAGSFICAKDIRKRRETIFRPPMPEYTKWLGAGELSASSVVFKIYISADGFVEGAINMQASGSPEIDSALARYIKKWRFVPVSGSETQVQKVKLNLDFE